MARRVIAVDFDLEAAGMHYFFGWTPEEMRRRPGAARVPGGAREATRRDGDPPALDDFLVEAKPERHAGGTLRFLPAGRLDDGYRDRLAAFDWSRFFAEGYGFLCMEHFRRELRARADMVMLDGRTGITGSGAVVTLQLADLVCLLFGMNDQGLDGTLAVARALRQAAPEGRAGRAAAAPGAGAGAGLGDRGVRPHPALARPRHGARPTRAGRGGDRPGAAPAHGLDTHLLPHVPRHNFGEPILFREPLLRDDPWRPSSTG